MRFFVKGVKNNISERNLIILLIGAALNVTILAVFLMINISDLSSVSKDVVEQQRYKLEHILEFASETLMTVTFAVFVALGRYRIHYGQFFAFLWMVIWLIITIMPFAIINDNFLELGILAVPGLIIYVGLFGHFLEVRTEAKIRAIEENRIKYL